MAKRRKTIAVEYSLSPSDALLLHGFNHGKMSSSLSVSTESSDENEKGRAGGRFVQHFAQEQAHGSQYTLGTQSFNLYHAKSNHKLINQK